MAGVVRRGKLVVQVKEASLMRDTELFSEMDPYCKILCGGIEVKTAVHEGAGKKPRWSEVRTDLVIFGLNLCCSDKNGVVNRCIEIYLHYLRRERFHGDSHGQRIYGAR